MGYHHISIFGFTFFTSPDYNPYFCVNCFTQFDNYEVYYNVNYARNGSSVDSIGDFESVVSKTSRLDENDNEKSRKKNYGEILGFKEEGETNEIEEEIKLCGKIDNKGWQWGNVVKNGNTLCVSHLSDVQNNAVWTTKKKSGLVSESATGCRPHRPKKRATTSPHEFYYYTGFGPSWGKKRGTIATTVASNSNTGYGTRVIDDALELDYFDNDDDDNKDFEEKGRLGITGKKRGRKPVKERSLKSLM